MMQVNRSRKPNHSSLAKHLLIAFVLAGIAFALAWVWQTAEQAKNPDSSENDPAVQANATATQTEESRTEQSASVSSEAQQASVSASAEASSKSSATTFVAQPMDGAVPASDPVNSTYFDDAIFLGDSITTGIALYHIADNAAVVAENGIGPGNILTKACIDVDGSGNYLTVLDAAKTYGERSKVYIMLGGNGIGAEKNTFIHNYKQFLDAVKAQYPHAIIYVQSITPVTADYTNPFVDDLNNAKIDEYNHAIFALTQQEDVYYLDINSVFKDENGALPKEASPVDGMHFSPEYYAKWFDYLKTHTLTVSVEGE